MTLQFYRPLPLIASRSASLVGNMAAASGRVLSSNTTKVGLPVADASRVLQRVGLQRAGLPDPNRSGSRSANRPR